MRILIVDDEQSIVRPLKIAFENRAFAVDTALDGQSGFELANISNYDCIVLDLNLPKYDGIEVAKKLRANGVTSPILMLTARDLKRNVWEGFESGADDYLTKPFDLKELMLRVDALIRRNSKTLDTVVEIGKLKINFSKQVVTVGSEVIILNNKEYGILEYLTKNRGRVISSEELLEHVWDSEIDSFTQTVRTNIKTLRQKVDNDKKLIINYRGKGYAIN